MDKKELRALYRGGGPPQRGVTDTINNDLFGWLSAHLPGTCAAYLATGHEIDLSGLFDRLPGWRWVLPRVEQDRSVTFRDRDVPRERHSFGMEQPVASGSPIPLREIDVLLVPGVAFGEDGRRLGHGAGHYDRILAGRRGDSVAIGVTQQDRVIEGIPETETDQRVEWLVSELGLRRCPRS